MKQAVSQSDSSMGKLKLLWSFFYGRMLFAFIKFRNRTFLDSLLALAMHLEDNIFPDLRDSEVKWFTLKLNDVNSVCRLSGTSAGKNFDLAGTETLASQMAEMDIRSVNLDTKLECGQIVDAFVMLLHVRSALHRTTPSAAVSRAWNSRNIASAMHHPTGFHKFCSIMRFDPGCKSYQVEYSFCELFFSRVIRSYVERRSRFRDHRVLFAAAPYVVLFFLVLFMFCALTVIWNSFVGYLFWLFGSIIAVSTLGFSVHAIASLQYVQEHQTELGREHTKRINELLTTLEARNKKLKDLEAMRDSLVHMIIHDMRSPLMGISGYLYLLQKHLPAESDTEAADMLNEAAIATAQLTEMVSAVLDVNRIEQCKISLNRKAHDLSALVKEGISKTKGLARGRNIVFVPPAAEVHCECDKDLVHRVMVNLIDNAVKFTPEDGAIRIIVKDQGSCARVDVIDSGPGIPAEYQQKIFDKFGRVEERHARQTYSTGLGLAFCKMVVESHGGGIGVISERGEGSDFWFTLPLRQTTETDREGK